MNRLLTWTFGCVTCIVMAADAEAQLVRVGPFGGVSVRAPFVSVDTLPFGGGTRVRAPFVSVNTRAYAFGYGYGYRPYQYDYYRPYGPVYYDPVVPAYRVPVYTPPLYPDVVYPQTGEYRASQPPISMEDSAALPDRLRAAALQLQRSLSLRRDDGDVWLNYLAPDRIVQVIDNAADPSSLSDLLLNYEGVVGNGSLASISRAVGFAETRRLLQTFVSMPATDSGQQKASTMKVESSENSILVPSPSSEVNSESKEPTPATPVKPADDGDNQEVRQGKEELPLPPPEPTPL